MSSSNIKTNLKFVMGNSRATKQTTKNIGTMSSEFQATININTNSKIKEKSINKRVIDNSKLKSRDNLQGVQSIQSQSSSNIHTPGTGLNLITPVISNNNHHVPPINTSNFIRKNIKTEKSERSEKQSMNKGPLELSLRTFLRDNSKENNYINSNNSTEGNVNKPKVEKIKSKHHKHASEIPQSFNNLAQLTEGNSYSGYNNCNLSNNGDNTFNQTSKTNFFDVYSQKPSQFLQKHTNSFIRDEIIQENEKKMQKTRSHNLLISQRDGSTSSVNRKVTAPTTDVEITDELPVRFSLGPSLNSNNTNTTSCSNCKDVKYSMLLTNFKQQEKNQKELLTTMEILKSYIKANQLVTEKKKLDIADKFNKKTQENTKLKEENLVIKKQNLELKLMLLKVLYEIKKYENNLSTRDMELNTLFNQVLAENEYLRYTNENVIGSRSDKNKNTLANKNNDNEAGTNSYSDLTENLFNEKPRPLHKRQKTHFNFHNLQNIVITDDVVEQASTSEMNTESDAKSVKSINTVVSSGENIDNVNKLEEDLFNSAFKEMSMHKTMKKMTDQHACINSFSNTNNFLNSSINSNPGQKSQKPVYLFYRTPSNKENKKIEFIK